MRPIDRVLETILYVDDLDAAERFYGGVLGLELDSRKDGPVRVLQVRERHAAAVRAGGGEHRS